MGREIGSLQSGPGSSTCNVRKEKKPALASGTGSKNRENIMQKGKPKREQTAISW